MENTKRPSESEQNEVLPLCGVVESAICTAKMQLRWKQYKGTTGIITPPRKVLQQKWISDKGEEKWEEIETVF